MSSYHKPGGWQVPVTVQTLLPQTATGTLGVGVVPSAQVAVHVAPLLEYSLPVQAVGQLVNSSSGSVVELQAAEAGHTSGRQ